MDPVVEGRWLLSPSQRCEKEPDTRLSTYCPYFRLARMHTAGFLPPKEFGEHITIVKMMFG